MFFLQEKLANQFDVNICVLMLLAIMPVCRHFWVFSHLRLPDNHNDLMMIVTRLIL